MDINYLLQREQIERMRADQAACADVRAAHSELADSYRALVDSHRRRRLVAVSVTPDQRLLH